MASKSILVLAFLLILSTSLFSQNGIIITEIMFDVPSDLAGDANGDGARGSRSDEFVEIYNSGTEAVDISAYQIIEREGIPVFTFPINTVLNPGQFAVVFGAVGTAGFGSHIPEGTLLFAVNEGTDENVGFNNGDGKSNLSNSRDRVMLVDVLLADTLQEVYWGGSSSNPMFPLSSKGIKLLTPNTVSSDSIAGSIGQSVALDPEGSNLWEMHTILTGEAENFFSPGLRAVEATGPPPATLILSEIMFDVPQDEAGDANGDGTRGSRSDEFVEIYNEGIVAVDVSGFQLLDREGIPIFTFPDGTEIEPEQFAVVFGAVGSSGFGELPPNSLYFAAQESDENVGFDNGSGKSNLSNGGDAILLINPAVADTVAEVYWGDAAPRSSKALFLGAPNTITGESISGSIRQAVTRKVEDPLWDLHTVVSADTNSYFSPGSNASKTAIPITGDLIITEVQFDVPSDLPGDANGDGVRGSRSDEFIELYNRGSSTINLEGYQIIEENGIAVFTFPSGASIEPNQFAVVFGAIGSAGYGAHIPAGTALFAVQESDENVGFDNGSGKSNLSSSGDLVALVNPAASDTLMEVYWGDANPLTSNAILLAFPNTVGGADLSGSSINQSVTHPLDSDKWGLHSTIANDPESLWSPGLDVIVTSVDDEFNIVNGFNLEQNYPNPFNPSTKISFSLSKTEKVSLSIYDVLGRKVAVLINNEQFAQGNHLVTFTPSSLASGIYFFTLKLSKDSITKKMIYIK